MYWVNFLEGFTWPRLNPIGPAASAPAVQHLLNSRQLWKQNTLEITEIFPCDCSLDCVVKTVSEFFFLSKVRRIEGKNNDTFVTRSSFVWRQIDVGWYIATRVHRIIFFAGRTVFDFYWISSSLEILFFCYCKVAGRITSFYIILRWLLSRPVRTCTYQAHRCAPADYFHSLCHKGKRFRKIRVFVALENDYTRKCPTAFRIRIFERVFHWRSTTKWLITSKLIVCNV